MAQLRLRPEGHVPRHNTARMLPKPQEVTTTACFVVTSCHTTVQVGLGFVLSGPRNRCPVVTKFQCQLQLLELLDHKSIFTVGYKSMLHIHSITEECEVVALEWELDKKTKQKKRCKFAKSNAAVSCRIAVERAICVETFEVNPQMGRFTMRDEGRTIAIGKVTRLPPGTGS